MLRRIVRAIRRSLRLLAPEYAVLEITRDDAISATNPAGGPISPGDIDFAWRHGNEWSQKLVTAWLIVHYQTMRDGYWPHIQKDEAPSHSGATHRSWQANAVEYAADISERLSWCGRDGVECMTYYQGGETERWRAVNDALSYVSGWGRPRIPYGVWLRQHRKRA